MAKKSDKGLLEDLIGETLDDGSENTTKTMALDSSPGSIGEMAGSIAEEFGGLPDAPPSDDDLMAELRSRRLGPKTSKLLIFLSIPFFIVGILGVLIKFKMIQMPAQFRKAIYNPGDLKVQDPKSFQGKKTDLVKVTITKPPPPKSMAVSPTADPAAPAPGMAPPPAPMAPISPVPAQAPTKTVVAATQPDAPAPPAPPAAAPPPPLKPVVVPSAPPVIPAAPIPKVPAPQKAEPKTPPKRPAAAPTSTAGGNGFSIQVGSYLFKGSLKVPMEKTVQLGFEPLVKTSEKKVLMNRVLVGDFQSEEVANGALKDLSEEGISGKVLKKSDGRFSVNAGAFFYEKEARALARKLEDFGYDVRMDKAKIAAKMQNLRVGRYGSEAEAESDLQRLRAGGLDGVVVRW